MAKAFFGGADADNVISLSTASVSRFHNLGMGSILVATTEAQATRTQRFGTTLSRLGINVNSNARTTATTFLTRIAGADGTVTITIPATTSGWLEDTSHSDSITAGQALALKSLTSTGLDALVISSYVILSDSTSPGTFCDYGWTAAGVSAGASAMRLTTASTTFYHTGICGRTLNTGAMYTTETADAKFKVRSPGFLTNAYAYILTNGRTTNCTMTLRLNGAAGANVVTITSATTGLFEDTSHSDTIVADDLVDFEIATGTGAGNLDVIATGASFEANGVSAHDVMCASNNVNLPGTVAPSFCPVFGYSFFTSTEATSQIKVPMATSFFKLRVRLGTNAGGANTFVTRINGADGFQSLAITAATTGFFEDNSHQDSVALSDLVNYKFGTSTNVSVNFRQITMISDPGGSPGGSFRGRRLQLRTF